MIGVVCKDGIILGTEKIVINKMMVSGTDKRAYSITKDVGCVFNGIVPDGRGLMYRGREEAKQYMDNFGIKIPSRVLADRIACYNQMHTMYSVYRPVGSTMIMACHDLMQGPTLWMVEPSGQCYQYHGCASGRGKQYCRNEIEKGFFKEKTCAEALPLVAKILLQAQEEMREKKQELELTILSEETGWVHKILDRATVDELTVTTKQQIEDDDGDMQ